MKRLFNEYLAENEDGRTLSDRVFTMMKDIAGSCAYDDKDLRDAEVICHRVVSLAFAEAILVRARRIHTKGT